MLGFRPVSEEEWLEGYLRGCLQRLVMKKEEKDPALATRGKLRVGDLFQFSIKQHPRYLSCLKQ